MAEKFNRDFKGVWIPKEVWLDSRLNALDKIILTEIDSLDQSDKGCYASNKYIAEFCQCSETKVSTAISKLVKLGYLQVQKFDGRQRELKSSLSNFERQTFNFCKADTQNLKESNIKNNTLTNTRKERKKAASSFDEIIAKYTSNEELKQALVEFIKMRKLMKKPPTDRALKLILSKLDDLATTDAEKVAIVNNSITRNWLGVFPLKEDYKKQPSAQPPNQETEEERLRREQNEKLLALIEGRA